MANQLNKHAVVLEGVKTMATFLEGVLALQAEAVELSETVDGLERAFNTMADGIREAEKFLAKHRSKNAI